MCSVTESGDVLVSLLLISYNQRKYIEEALQSALSQNYSGLQVVVSDDNSTDGTWEVIQEFVGKYSGPHQVLIRKNERNEGFAKNFNEGIKNCAGDLIVVQAGDDVSEKNRVAALVNLWLVNDKKPDLLYSNVIWVRDNGDVIRADSHRHIIPSLQEVIKGEFYIAGGMSAAYTKRLFEKFGYLSDAVKTEDYVLTFRALISGGVAFESSPLLRYRQHAQSEMAIRSAISNEYQRALRYSYAAVAEAEDRYRSWKASNNKAILFELRLKMALVLAKINHKSVTGGLGERMLCAVLAIICFNSKLFKIIVKRDMLESKRV